MFIQNYVNTDNINATKQLSAPVGYNLNSPNPSLTPNDGSLALNSNGSLYYAGNNIWKPVGASQIPAYAYIYNTSEQFINDSSPLTFDSLGNSNNITFVPGSSNVIFDIAGVYSIIYYIQTFTESNNQFCIFKNGTKAGPTAAVFYLSPLPNSGYSIISFNAGDIMTLVSRIPISNELISSLDGFGDPIVNASLLITKLA